MASAATAAAYWPAEWPAMAAGLIVMPSSTASARMASRKATLVARMAGWALTVRSSSSAGPSRIIRDSGMPSAASARSKAAAAAGDRSISSAPMPTYWEPWPGNTKAIERGRCALASGESVIGTTSTGMVGRSIAERARSAEVRSFDQRLSAGLVGPSSPGERRCSRSPGMALVIYRLMRSSRRTRALVNNLVNPHGVSANDLGEDREAEGERAHRNALVMAVEERQERHIRLEPQRREAVARDAELGERLDRKSTRLNSSHL